MIEVELLDYMGSDTTVAKAARVSFQADEYRSKEDNERLINYLAKHGHWSPFAHCFLQFRIKAPLFVARQLAKHRVGLSWNEVSRRYVDTKPDFFAPEAWRGRPVNKKQGSSGAIKAQRKAEKIWEGVVAKAFFGYSDLLEMGVAPEQARMILPQCAYTEWYWSGSLHAFSRICKQRLDHETQLETQEIAKEIDSHCGQKFPASWAALEAA